MLGPNFDYLARPEVRKQQANLDLILNTDYNKLLNKNTPTENNSMFMWAALAALAIYVAIK